MKIHYFQRYHAKENVATANTMLLLSRLYAYSSDKFFAFLKSEFFDSEFEPELTFRLQEKSEKSIPDATITQESFKIVVEAKMSDWFYSDQLMRHLESFGDEKYKVLITIAPESMGESKMLEFEEQLAEYNEEQKYKVIHKNTTFENLVKGIQEFIDERDYEMQDVVEDYLNYCYNDKLIIVPDSWKYLKMQGAGNTFEFNLAEGVYYDGVDKGFTAHDYLGLYTNKSVRAIGKVCAYIVAVETDEGMLYDVEFGELTEERKEKIQKAMRDGCRYGYDLRTQKHRYFFVEKFYETDFKKITRGGALGSRIFDLSQIFETDQLPSVEEMAELLKEKTWN